MARLSCSLLSLLFWFGIPLIAELPHTDFKCTQSGSVKTCHLDQPVVNQPRTEYRSVTFQPNENVVVTAGGCVQTGGHGLTWKLYVNPQGPNSDRLYHGLITIPGITGPSLVRIQGIVGKQLRIPATIDPNNNFLVLGYEDDGYGDNGYTAHDDGTGNQCKDAVAGKPAWVTIQITQNAPPPKETTIPFDLVWTNVDPSYIPFNPEWAYEKANAGQHPNPATLCGGFPLLGNGTGVSLGSPPCTSQSPIVNPPAGWTLNSFLCGEKAQSGHLDGHLNWMAASFSGTIQWDNHKDWTKQDDDDYNFNFFPDTATGLTSDNLSNFGGRPMIETEFDSDETVDLIDKGWWNTFHKAVDANGGEPGGVPGQMIDSHRAIVAGLFGLDSEHGSYSELHPVWGMAIEVQEGVASDDQWSFLVRNWGDEGYCSQDSETLPITTMSFFIPMPGATGVTANTDELYQSHNGGGSSYDTGVSVTSAPGGAIVTFDVGPPSAQMLVSGLIHFAWTTSTGQLKPPVRVPPIKVTLAPPRQETYGPGAAATALFTALPADKQAQLRSKMVKPAQTVTPSKSVRRVASIAVTRRTGPTRSQRVANPRKSNLDLIRGQAFCGAYNGKIPNAPATLCTSLK
ncbi:MAG TPA: hypothetical protein VH302_12360 [Bryobacteraceae bacterium]|nr:hypothetical protein [Bryobacteraceae bacterium]